MLGQCFFRYSGNSSTVIPSIPALPLLLLTRANACSQFFRSQTSSISCSLLTMLSALRFAISVSVPSPESLGASLLLISVKANSSWFFCRLSLMSCAAYLPLSLTPAVPGTVQAFITFVTTMPSADFCRLFSLEHSSLSRVFTTNDRSPEVSSTAFDAQPPDLQPASLMDMGFVVICQLAQRRMPLIRFLSIGSRLCSMLLSDPASRRRPYASLTLHLHQVE